MTFIHLQKQLGWLLQQPVANLLALGNLPEPYYLQKVDILNRTLWWLLTAYNYTAQWLRAKILKAYHLSLNPNPTTYEPYELYLNL